MRAIVYHEYGLPHVLRLEVVEMPAVGDEDVLVRVHASSVNSWDWDRLRGTPLVNRIPGLFKPSPRILGADIAGRVEAVGRSVDRFRPGDEVYGDVSGCGWGGFAEYVSAPADVLAPKPAGLTFEEAAAVPQAGVLALQGLRRGGPIRSGEKVLVNGAGGGAGTFAVQIARSSGAEVVGVDSAVKLDVVRSIGATDVIDFAEEDFTRGGILYDRIYDAAAHHSVLAYRRTLKPHGSYTMVGGSGASSLQLMVLGPIISLSGSRKMRMLLHRPSADDLVQLTGWLETGAVVPVIDRTYALREVPEALRYFGDGLTRGKVVITVPGDR